MRELSFLLILSSCTGLGLTGDECEENSDCLGDICRTEVADKETKESVLDFPDGYCTNECDFRFDWTCERDEVCLWWPDEGLDSWIGNCYQSCLEDGDCREGYICHLGIGFTKFWTACFPEKYNDNY